MEHLTKAKRSLTKAEVVDNSVACRASCVSWQVQAADHFEMECQLDSSDADSELEDWPFHMAVTRKKCAQEWNKKTNTTKRGW